MMTHVAWKGTLPVCELSARSEYASLSIHPELRVDGDLRSSLQALGDQKQQGFPVDEIKSLRRDILTYFKRPGQARLAVPLVIINDQALGTMKSRQKSRGMPDYGLDLAPVDFAAIARACGLNGVTVDNPEALEKEL